MHVATWTKKPIRVEDPELLNPLKTFFLLYGVLLYLHLGTGIHSDDYSFLAQVKSDDFFGTIKAVFSAPTFLFSPLAIFFDFIQFYIFGYSDLYYDIVKSLISLFAIYAAWIFSKQYLSQGKAFLFSFIFVLYPTHDAINYWTTGTYLLITGGLLMLSQFFVNSGRIYIGGIFGFIGAFWSYASPPIVAGLSVTFLFRREYRKFLIFITPGFLYILYYFAISSFFEIHEFRTENIFSPYVTLKQFVFQIGTFLDVAIGPSLWLKLYSSILANTPTSFIFSLFLTIILFKFSGSSRDVDPTSLIISFLGLLFASLFVFSLSGALPQIAFNLGNRVTYFGSMFLALMVVLCFKNKLIKVLIIFIFASCILGISNHWKSWNLQQKEIIHRIKSNDALSVISSEKLFIVGNQYSQLSEISHIEFLSTRYVANAVFEYARPGASNFVVQPLTQYHHFQDGQLFDKKFGDQITLTSEMLIFDVSKNELLKLPSSEFNGYMSSQPKMTRHWTQMIAFGPLRKIVLSLQPNLKYHVD